MASCLWTLSQTTRQSHRQVCSASQALALSLGKAPLNGVVTVPAARVPTLPRPRDVHVDLWGAERHFKAVLASKDGAPRVSKMRSGVDVIQACAARGEVSRAEAWLLRFRRARVFINVRAYNAAMHACARVADVVRTEGWLLGMIDGGVEPNVISFNTLLGAFAEAGDVSGAHRWFSRMTEAGVEADAVTYRTMIATCARAANAPLAEEWLLRMKAAMLTLDVVSCSALVSAYAKSGDAKGAERSLRLMEENGIVAGRAGYDPVIRAWAAGGAGSAEPMHAECWIWKALEAGVEPTDAALVAVMAAFVRSEDANGAQRIADVMRRLGRWPSAAASAVLARPHAAAGNFEAIENLLDELVREGGRPDAVCLQELLAAYARSPQPPEDDRAEICFRELCFLDPRAIHGAGEALGDVRRALGRRRYAALAASMGLCTRPAIPRPAHAKSRVVGRLEVIEACQPAE